ncbi:MAG: ASKHA domain-containing protein [Oscillospiraceae bacterium]|nr:ASKHA domain-containing protein [Oscillospiraceae bacterium]
MDKNMLGVAIDIGTTTVALHLTDMETGVRLATVGGVNAQSPYGADVTSRIRYSKENGHELLTCLIREQISSMIGEACLHAKAQPSDIEYITIAANTIMQHLVAGYSPVNMGVAPFTPMSLFGEELPVWDGLPVADSAKIYYTPAISAYVGGDITAGLFAAGFEDLSEPAIFLDIGTNGEIVLKHKNTYYCCATAAGPAFEGAEITMGMAAVDGAIDHVSKTENRPLSCSVTGDNPRGGDGSLSYSVIGGGVAKGICGSGLLDLLAVLLDTGEVDETGRLLRKTENRPLSYEVYITAGDIRQLQLAKAAIAAGIEVLIHFAGVSVNDIKLLALAGGFGSYMDLESAARIGLFPKELLPVAKAFGNTAGEGAALALCSPDSHRRLKSIQARCEYIELSTMTFFNDKFVDQMGFE